MLNQSQVRGVDPVNTNLVLSYKQSKNVYMGERIFPVIDSESSGTYHKWGAEAFLGTGEANPAGDHGLRAIGGSFARMPRKSVTNPTYLCKEYGFEIPLDDRLAANADQQLALEVSYNMMIMHETLRAQELRVKAIVFSTGSITNNTTLSGTSQWSDYASGVSDPIDDIETGIETLKLAVAFDPATMELAAATNPIAMRYLRWHPDIISKLGSNLTQKVNESELMEFFGFTEINVSDAVYNSAKPGQTVVKARLWGDDFLIYVRPINASMADVLLGATFQEREIDSENYREEPRNTVHLVSHAVQNKLTDALAGYLIKDVSA